MIEIRPIESPDHDQWLPLWLGYNAFYGRFGGAALAPDITTESWRRLLDPEEPMWALVAVRDGRLVGLAQYLFHHSTTALAPACYLQDLYISEDQRGHGIGRALIEQVYRNATELGCQSIYWQTHRSNTQAMHLYDKVAEQSEFLIYRKSS